MRFLKTLAAFACILLISLGAPSCKGPKKSSCMQDMSYKKYHKKTRHSNYGSMYRPKSTPVHKDYVIKNKKRR